MSFISKILDVFKLESTGEIENVEEISISDRKEEKTSNAYNQYYENISKEKENNLQITCEDVECYDLRPFDLNKPFISDGNFVAIELEGANLEKAYEYMQAVHDILEPYKHLFENAIFPDKIRTDYWVWNPENHLPVSHLRLTPYTATMKENKYPFYLWLSYCGDCGAEYVYMIYFNQLGKVGKCDLSLSCSNSSKISYETKIRQNEHGLYVMRITRTLYIEPYGTEIIYHYKDDASFSEQKKPKKFKKHKTKRMSQYEIEQFAKACNAYMIREERKERQETGKIHNNLHKNT